MQFQSDHRLHFIYLMKMQQIGFNSLAPGRFQLNLKSVILKQILVIGG